MKDQQKYFVVLTLYVAFVEFGTGFVQTGRTFCRFHNTFQIHNVYNENNIAISPYGALSVMVALGEGLQGEAVKEIQHAAHIPNDISIIRIGLRDIHRHLKSYFIPREGFLAGLTLNHENVTLRPEYQEILKFYGYDAPSFNNALYPEPQPTEKPSTTMEPEMTTQSHPPTTPKLVTMEAVTTTKAREMDTVTEPTVPATLEAETTIQSVKTTTEEVMTLQPAFMVATTTKESETTIPEAAVIATEMATASPVLTTTLQSSTAPASPTIESRLKPVTLETATNTPEPITTTTVSVTTTVTPETTTLQSVTTTESIKTTLQLVTTTLEPATSTEEAVASTGIAEEQATATSTPTSTTVQLVLTTVEPVFKTVEPEETTPEPTTTTMKEIITTMEPVETTEEPVFKTVESEETTPEPTTTTMKAIITTMEPVETTEEAVEITLEPITTTTPQPIMTTLETVIRTSEPTTTTLEAQITTLQPVTTTLGPVITTLQSVTGTTATTSPVTGTESTTLELVTTTPESVVTVQDVAPDTSQAETLTSALITTTLSADVIIVDEDATDSVPEPLPTSTTSENPVETTLATTLAPTEPAETTQEDSIDNEILPNDRGSSPGLGFAGSSLRRARSQFNVIELNRWRGKNATTPRRKPRSVVDYMLARYYDDHHLLPHFPRPFLGEERPSFLVQGKYREYGINFMKYNTVLPFVYVIYLDALALSFPLDSSKYYLLLLLPRDETGVDKLICDLSKSGSLKSIVDNLRYTRVIATIPSFSLKGYVTLTPSFQELGIKRVFEPRQSDFSPMTEQQGIYVKNIEQAITVNIRNYVDPNTLVINRRIEEGDPIEFKADHPFIYFVMDAELHVALMEGKIVNPLNSRIR